MNDKFDELAKAMAQAAGLKSLSGGRCRMKTDLGIEARPTGHHWMTRRQGRAGFKHVETLKR